MKIIKKLKKVPSWILKIFHDIRNFDPMILKWLNDMDEPVRNWQNIGLSLFFLSLGYISRRWEAQGYIWAIVFILVVNYIGFRLSHKAEQARMMIDYMARDSSEESE